MPPSWPLASLVLVVVAGLLGRRRALRTAAWSCVAASALAYPFVRTSVDLPFAGSLAPRSDEAERVLESREPVTLTPAARIFISWIKAQIAFERGDYELAKGLFRLSLTEVERDSPTAWEGIQLTMEAGLGLTLARLGDREAWPLLVRTVPFVVADGDPVLLERCQAALRETALSPPAAAEP